MRREGALIIFDVVGDDVFDRHGDDRVRHPGRDMLFVAWRDLAHPWAGGFGGSACYAYRRRCSRRSSIRQTRSAARTNTITKNAPTFAAALMRPPNVDARLRPSTDLPLFLRRTA